MTGKNGRTPKQMGKTARWVKVGPDSAGDWLALNIRNRKLRERKVRRYAKEMSEGRWMDNGESVKFDWHGFLLDGQHRLAAVIYAKVTVEMLVVEGLDPSSYDTIDTGIPRGIADALFVMGEIDSSRLATALGALWRYEVSGAFTRVPGVEAPTNGILEDVLQRHPDLKYHLRPAYAVARKLNISMGSAVVCMYITHSIDSTDAGLFWDYLQSGEDLKSNSPIYRLRERLLSRMKLSADDQGALVFKAWNLYRENKTVQALSWKPAKEAMPVPV